MPPCRSDPVLASTKTFAHHIESILDQSRRFNQKSGEANNGPTSVYKSTTGHTDGYLFFSWS